MWQVRSVRLLAVVAAGLLLAAAVAMGDVIYMDLSGIDSIPGLTPAQKQELKDKIVLNMSVNYMRAGHTITADPAQKATADRRVNLAWELGQSATGFFFGEWPHGSAESKVFVRNFIERDFHDDYKTGGQWDVDKLARAIERTAAHEVAHSYSVGHNDHDPPDKMTEGSLVGNDTRANSIWWFDNHTNRVLDANKGQPPCQSAADYDLNVLSPIITTPQNFAPNMSPDEADFFDANLFFGGPLASDFELGWYGFDTDDGLTDGNAEFDFIYKTSLTGLPGEDAQLLTFILANHDNVHLVLRGVSGSPWAGQWFPMSGAMVMPDAPQAALGGVTFYRLVTVMWSIDAAPGPDVMVTLDAQAGYLGGVYGWQIAPGRYTLNVNGGTGGGSYGPGTIVAISANVPPGYSFAGWSGDIATLAAPGDPATTIEMNGNCAVTANFVGTTVTVGGALSRGWVYQNTPVTTGNRHVVALSVTVSGSADYVVEVMPDRTSSGVVSVEPTADPLVWLVRGSPRQAGGMIGTGPVNLNIFVTDLLSGAFGAAQVEVTSRPLGDIDGAGGVSGQDKLQINKRLNGLVPDGSEYDLDGLGGSNGQDKLILNKILNGLWIP